MDPLGCLNALGQEFFHADFAQGLAPTDRVDGSIGG